MCSELLDRVEYRFIFVIVVGLFVELSECFIQPRVQLAKPLLMSEIFCLVAVTTDVFNINQC